MFRRNSLGALELLRSTFMSGAPHVVLMIEILFPVIPAACADIKVYDPVGSIELAERQREPRYEHYRHPAAPRQPGHTGTNSDKEIGILN